VSALVSLMRCASDGHFVRPEHLAAALTSTAVVFNLEAHVGSLASCF
jgi:hypothetical protein